MIELLLQAERALSFGLLDQAERLYRQAADADPRNAIAVVGLARVALERDDEERALELGARALTIDPENQTAKRLVARLREVRSARGVVEPPARPPAPPPASPAPSAEAASAPAAAPRPGPGRKRSRLQRWLRRG